MQFDQHKIFEILPPNQRHLPQNVYFLVGMSAFLVKNIGNDVVHVINNNVAVLLFLCSPCRFTTEPDQIDNCRYITYRESTTFKIFGFYGQYLLLTSHTLSQKTDKLKFINLTFALCWLGRMGAWSK